MAAAPKGLAEHHGGQRIGAAGAGHAPGHNAAPRRREAGRHLLRARGCRLAAVDGGLGERRRLEATGDGLHERRGVHGRLIAAGVVAGGSAHRQRLRERDVRGHADDRHQPTLPGSGGLDVRLTSPRDPLYLDAYLLGARGHVVGARAWSEVRGEREHAVDGLLLAMLLGEHLAVADWACL